MPSLRRADLGLLRWHWNLHDDGLRAVTRLGAWTFGFVVANQVALFVVILLAGSVAGPDPVSSYTYAYAFFQLPYGIIAVTVMSVVTPDLAEKWSTGQRSPFLHRMTGGLRAVLALIIPSAVGMLLLAKPAVALLLGHGHSTPASTATTGAALAMFSLGLPGFCTYLYLVRVLQSMQRTKVAFYLYLVENALNIALAVVLVRPLGVRGLALVAVDRLHRRRRPRPRRLPAVVRAPGRARDLGPALASRRGHGPHGRGRARRVQPLGLDERRRPAGPGGGCRRRRGAHVRRRRRLAGPAPRRPAAAAGRSPTEPVRPPGRTPRRGPRRLRPAGPAAAGPPWQTPCMPGVHIVTDSACDLSDQLVKEHNVIVVPLTIRFGAEELEDRRQLSPAEFWERCRGKGDLPETAAPSPGAFQAAFQQAADEGADSVLCLTISSKVSGTYGSAVTAAGTFGSVPVTVLDTFSLTMGQGLLVIAAAEEAAGGAGVDDLVDATKDRIGRTRIYGVLGGLEFLQRGGRIGGARALLGSLLNIKPVIQLKDGEVAEESKQRTRGKALAYLSAKVAADAPLERIAVADGACDDFPDVLARLAGIDTEHPLLPVDLGPVVGTHAGPNTVGVCYIVPARTPGTAG